MALPVTAMAAVSRSNHSNCCSRSTASSCPRSPHLPRLQRGAATLPPSPPSDGSKTALLLPLRRGEPLCVQLPCPPGPPMPPSTASTSQHQRTASRTNTGAAASRGRLPLQPQRAVKLLEGSPEAKVTPVGCAVRPPITGQLNLEGISVLGLVDTGASVTCMGFSVWWQYRAQWGPLKPFEGVVHGAHGKPLQIAGKTQHLNLQWDEARGRASFIVIIGLESPPVLIGMDSMHPLRVRIYVTHGTATPAEPDPQTIHLNAAQTQDLPPTSRTLLLQAIDILA